MPSEITMPALSPTMEKGNLARWLVREGDAVRSGDLLAEIETDKATMEFEATDEGVISRIVVAEGTDDVAVGTVIALIGPEDGPEDGGVAARMTDASQDIAGPAAAEPTAAATPAAPPTAETTERRKASPLARRIAQAKGIDLSGVLGTGTGGKIVKSDLGLPQRQAAPAPTAPGAAATVSHALPAGVPYETIRLSGMRKTIAARLSQAKQTVPHFYLNVDIRLDALLGLRRDLNASGESRGVKLSVNDFLIKAAALALEMVPDANVQFGGDQLYRFQRVDISMAVAVSGGLVTPVIRDAANKRLSRIASEVRTLAARARDGKLAPEEYQGGTASISNLGMFGMSSIVPILSPSQALIVGIGAGEERPYACKGELIVATLLTATGSFDHRAIDGAVGAEYMRTLKNLVEQPVDILL